MYSVKEILPNIKTKPALCLPKQSVKCYFQAEKYRADGTITYRGPWFANTVLDSGLDQLAYGHNIELGGSGVVNYINVGTGTSDPLVTQTGLDSYLASTASTYGSDTHAYSNGDEALGEPAWRSNQRTFAFAVGFTGGNVNLTELGLSRLSNGAYFNRQLFRDENNDPTVIQIQDDEGLRVAVKVVIYAPMAVGETATADFTLDGETRAATVTQIGGNWLTTSHGRVEVCNLSRSQTLQIATESGSFIESNSRIVEAYSAGSFYRDADYIFNPGRFIGEWKKARGYILVSSFRYTLFEIVLDTAKTVGDTEEITITLRRSWGRV